MNRFSVGVTKKSLSCSIIGGGISGLIAGKLLQQYGFNLTILDKGRGLGGRIVTRRIRNTGAGEGIFDYGIQYITDVSQELKRWLGDWEAVGLVSIWNWESRSSEDMNIQKYGGIKSMRSIAQHIAVDLNTYNSKKITSLSWDGTSWNISADDESSYIIC
ncbi:MAG: NAD(P)-binding protein [Richelia sp.]|nr:NAD(P)-binding protein [Richelia sp.]